MEELFDLKYKEEVEELKDEDDYEVLGDTKYIFHKDIQARLYWAFCRPSGSHIDQLKDPDPLVSIMAFNHSRLGALKRFELVHKEVINDDNLRVKISKRSRMLFRDLIDNDFTELNLVLEIVPVFLDLAIDQLINGRKWNDIPANTIEATKFLNLINTKMPEKIDQQFLEALYEKLQIFEEFSPNELKTFLEKILVQKNQICPIILNYYHEKAIEYLNDCDLHILQKKSVEILAQKLL